MNDATGVLTNEKSVVTHPARTSLTSTIIKEAQERFEKLWAVEYPDGSVGVSPNEGKAFIAQEIKTAVEKVVESVKEEKRKAPQQAGKWMPMDDKNEGYNQAVNDIITSLTPKENKI